MPLVSPGAFPCLTVLKIVPSASWTSLSFCFQVKYSFRQRNTESAHVEEVVKTIFRTVTKESICSNGNQQGHYNWEYEKSWDFKGTRMLVPELKTLVAIPSLQSSYTTARAHCYNQHRTVTLPLWVKKTNVGYLWDTHKTYDRLLSSDNSIITITIVPFLVN